MITNIPHITSLMMTSWCAWTMLALLFFAVLSEWIQPGIITQAYTSLKVRQERVYKDAPTSIVAQLLNAVFVIGTFAMAIAMCLAQDSSLSFAAYTAICGVIGVVLLIKVLGTMLIDYTFQWTRTYGNAYEHYANICTLTMVILYPLLLVFLHIDSLQASRWLLVVIVSVFMLMWLYRTARQFVHSPMAIVYLILYIATLDVLPMAGIVLCSEKLLSII